MAIETFVMVNVIGKKAHADAFAEKLFTFRDVQLVDTMEQIDSGRFTLPVKQENMNDLMGLAELIPGSELTDEKPYLERIKNLEALYGNRLVFDPGKSSNAFSETEGDRLLEKADQLRRNREKDVGNLDKLREQKAGLESSIHALSYLKDIDIPLNDLFGMRYFSSLVGTVSEDNADRLEQIRKVITSVIYPLGSEKNTKKEFVYLVITPKSFEVETMRLLKTLSFKTVSGIDTTAFRSAKELITVQKRELEAVESTIAYAEKRLSIYLDAHYKDAQMLYDGLKRFVHYSAIKKKMAFSNERFYFSAWIPENKKEEAEVFFNQYPEMVGLFIPPDGENRSPVKLKNNWFFRPFENLLSMYGPPSHDELDPTPFLAVTYLLCFGYMFGDVGQGLILILGGLFAAKKLKIPLGDVAVRMGLASVVFGFLYGSVFGNETLLPALWIRPMKDITTALIGAVIMGVIMLLGAYVFNILNCLRRNDLKEGLFGPNGIAGLLLYLGIIGFAVTKLNVIEGLSAVSTPLLIMVIIMVVLVLFREPLANKLKKKPLYDSAPSDYYIDAGFGLFEMALSMLSNTVSFIRVGAFALTHAGMFMAFETLSGLVGGGIGGIVIMIIGNLFIIVMEGLIDFIQCLRLQFYELFSKYYAGEGKAFVPMENEIQNTTV